MSVCSPNYGADGNFPYRWCIVPECDSSSVKTPKKLWIEAPTDVDTRMIWLNLAFRDSKKLPISKNQMYFCEDHFDLEHDMEIYEQNKTMGSVDQVRMKLNCVPTRFNCQKDRIKTLKSHQQPQFLVYSPTNQPVSALPQAQKPILLTLVTEDNPHSCLPADITNTELLVTLFCVCCLTRHVPFITLVTCCHAEFLNSMMMPEIKPKNKVICHQCHDMLKKIKQFKLQVEESFKLLSNSSENVQTKSNQRLNYRPSNFSMVVPDANRKKKPVKHYNTTIPHTIRIKPNIGYDLEKNEAKDETKNIPTPKSSEKKDNHTNIIKEAFKIINSNQNSESINLLANSLQNLSSTLLSEMICPNFDLGRQFDTAVPADINQQVQRTVTSSTENITYVNEKNALIADTTNADVKPAISTENISDVKEQAFQDDSINVQNANVKDTEHNTNNLEEIALKADSSNISTNLAISSENLMNILGEIATKAKYSNKTTSSPTENRTKTKTEKKSPGSYSIKDYTINFTNSTMSLEELTNIIKDDERITCDTYGFDDYDGLDAGEELNKPVTKKENSIGVDEPEEQVSFGGDKSYGQPVGTPIALDGPILGENIIQLTLTREQLMEERAKKAASQAYLRAPHKCESCIIGFEFRENLEDHFKRKHTRVPGKRRDIICDVCGQFVEHGAIYNMHMFYHHTRYCTVAPSPPEPKRAKPTLPTSTATEALED